MDAVVARLKELKYLSDTRFAEDYTRVRKEHEKFGRRRVQQDLAQKGVEKELIASTLETAYEDVDEVALARAVYCAEADEAAGWGEWTEGDGADDGAADARGVFGRGRFIRCCGSGMSRSRRSTWGREENAGAG